MTLSAEPWTGDGHRPGTPTRRRGNLPAQLSSFVGRRREIGEVKHRVAASRLVTLTGVGGAGKTRLALQVAADVQRMFPEGAWFVDLTRLDRSNLSGADAENPDVIAALALAALGVPQQSGGRPVDLLAGYMADRRVLLVLDNCEQVATACAFLAEKLLAACPGLRLLATSREPLAVSGETLFPVPPLPTPDEDGRQLLDDLAGCESVALFVARAQAAVPDAALTPDNCDAVADLCRRLDGLPLAIELAAARVRALAPQQILDRLSDRFALLSRGDRTAPTRQQTLYNCVEWSYDLCSEPEQLLWARLSVFVGGFDLDAVTAVCTDARLPADALVDVLTGLVEKSIVDRAETGPRGPARYRMLESIRYYGREQLAATEEPTEEQGTLRRRHRDWYQQLTLRADAEWTRRQSYWYDRLAEEQANTRAAIEFSLTEPGEAGTALRILTGLPLLYWYTRNLCGDGMTWFQRALAQATAPTQLRAQALAYAGFLAVVHGHGETVWRPLLDEAEALGRDLGDASALALAATARAHDASQRGDLSGIVDVTERGLAVLPHGPPTDPRDRGRLLLHRGTATAATGDHDQARRCYQEVVDLHPRGESSQRTNARWGLGFVAWRRGEVEEANRQLAASLRTGRDAGFLELHCTAVTHELLAWVAGRQGRHHRAATLLGVAHAALDDIGRPLLPMFSAEHTACAEQAREALGDTAFTSAFRRGQALPFDDAIAYALDDPRQSSPSPPSTGDAQDDVLTPLTPREQEVAELVARGLSNKEIAHALVISQRTAEGHVQRLLTKLGFANRSQIAAQIARREPDQDSPGR